MTAKHLLIGTAAAITLTVPACDKPSSEKIETEAVAQTTAAPLPDEEPQGVRARS